MTNYTETFFPDLFVATVSKPLTDWRLKNKKRKTEAVKCAISIINQDEFMISCKLLSKSQ